MSNLFVPIQRAELQWYEDLPFFTQYNDIYHSVQSALDQSRYVFIDGNDLINRWSALPKGSPVLFNIAETSFGTGLKFLLSWSLWEQYAPESAMLHFISCEKKPLSAADLIRSCAAWPEFSDYAEQLIANYPILTPGYHQLSFLNGRIKLTLMLGDVFECYEQLLLCAEPKLEDELRTSWIDAWYLDDFASAKNESMCSDSLIGIIAMLSRQGTTLATYFADSDIKKTLNAHGFILTKECSSKFPMLSAYFSKNNAQKPKKRHTPWHTGSRLAQQGKNAIILGAGLAGCFTANALARRGWKVTLIDENAQVGSGASGIKQAVLFPKLSAYRSPLTQFMLSSFLYAVQRYRLILAKHQIGELKGSLLLAYNEKEKKVQQSLFQWLQYYPELGQLVDAQFASELTGLSVEQSGLYIPLSGWINAPALCQVLANTEGVSLITNTSVRQLHFENNNWKLNDLQTQVLILANGHQLKRFQETLHVPITPVRGQMTAIAANRESSFLTIPLCADGNVLPQINGVHHTGASYGLGIEDAQISLDDDEFNMSKLRNIAPAVAWSKQIVDHWAGIRATTPDYLPLVGPLPVVSEFLSLYSGLAVDAKRWVAQPGPYYPGLYSCVGFGSRGVSTIPLCAEWLASSINNELSCLPRNLIQALSPARFLRANITRGLY